MGFGERLAGLRRRRGQRRAPMPPAHPVWGHLRERRRDALGLFLRAAEDYGPIVRFRLGLIESHLVTEPDFIHHVLFDAASNYRKGPIFSKMELAIGKGLITSDGEHWRRQRRLVQPVFAKATLPRVFSTMRPIVEARIDEWMARDAGARVDATERMLSLTMDIICAALFGEDALPRTSRLATAGHRFADEVSAEVLALFTPRRMLFDALGFRPRHPATAVLRRIVAGLVDERAGSARDDDGTFVGRLLASRDAEGRGMTREELLDEVLTLFAAGHETTAMALAWTLLLVADHADVQEEIAAEAERVFGGRTPTFDDVDRLERARAAVEEAMRLYPPVWSFPRQALADDEIGGFHVPRGSFVVVSPWVMHRLSRWWEAPDTFAPARFSRELVERRPKLVYLPFGAGARQCAGLQFAMVEMVLVVATLLRRARIVNGAPGEPLPTPLPLVTLRPDRPVWIRLEPRPVRSPERSRPTE